MSRRFLMLAAFLATLATTPSSHAQTWPTRPLKLVVPFTAGSSSDTIARLTAAGHIPAPSTPEAMLDYTRSEIAKFDKLIKADETGTCCKASNQRCCIDWLLVRSHQAVSPAAMASCSASSSGEATSRPASCNEAASIRPSAGSVRRPPAAPSDRERARAATR